MEKHVVSITALFDGSSWQTVYKEECHSSAGVTVEVYESIR